MNPIDHPATPEDAAKRVLEWLRQFHTMRGLDPELIHRANYAPLNVSDLTMLVAAFEPSYDSTPSVEAQLDELGRRKADCQNVRDMLLPVLAEHPQTRDDVDVVDEGKVKVDYLVRLAVRLIDHLIFENETNLQGLWHTLEGTQRALTRMEQARDELRVAIAGAAGVDLEKVSQIDVDFVHEVRELGIEKKRLEENLEFTDKVLHTLLGCCDGELKECDWRAATGALDAVRRGEVPQVDTTVDVQDVLASRARNYAEQRDAESGGTHNIDGAFWDDMAAFQTKGLRLAQSVAHRDLVFALRRQIRAWKAEKRTGKELGTPNEIARDDGYAGGRVDAAYDLEYLINESRKVGRR